MDARMMRTWAEVSLDNLEHNYKALTARLGNGTRLLGVVKSDAYGHGAIPVSRLLEELGCRYLAVACLNEAVELRQAGIEVPILILGYTPPKYAQELISYNLTQSVNDFSMAQELSVAVRSLRKRLKVHLKVDTGMGRMGFPYHHGASMEHDLLITLAQPGLDFEGIFTHFAVADKLGDPYTKEQFNTFCSLTSKIEYGSGVKFEIKHCANSAAVINYKETYLDMVRPGIVLYGCYPGKETDGLEIKPVMKLKTRIVQINDFRPGYTISYGRKYMVRSNRKIAVVPVGYADGLTRVLSGKINMLVHGKRVAQVGRICMDMCMIDVTGVPEARVGDVVTVFGSDEGEFISVDELAEKAGTISYEMLCGVGKRIPRLYSRRGVTR